MMDQILDAIITGSPIAYLVALALAILWANNLTRTTNDQQRAISDQGKALLAAVNRQGEIETRVTIIETDKRHMEDSLEELPKIRQELMDIKVLVAKARDE